MRHKLKLKKVISAVELSLWPVWSWPLPKDATKLKTTCMKLFQYFCITLTIGVEVPLIYAITNHVDDLAILIELILEAACAMHALSNIIFHRVNYHHIQNVTFKMEDFCNLMKPHEEVVIQRYIDKYVVFYGTSLLIIYLTGITVIAIVPTITGQPFPTLAEYPFDVHYEPLRTIIYIHQSLVGMILSGQLCINIFMGLLLWFVSARFEMLTAELRTITNIYQLFKCIRKHQELLGYTTEVFIVARSFVLTSICCSTVNLIVVGVSFLSNSSLAYRLQYVVIAAACLSEVFMYAWPAEHLLFVSNDVAQAAFDMYWYNQSIEIWKCLKIIIMRNQKSITLAIPCITPSVSFSYFTSYCSTILSYFTTLRVMLDNDKNYK